MAAARGHAVTVLEAAGQPGGQLRLAARQPRRREMLSIIDWRMAECTRAGVDVRFNIWAEAADVLATAPDVVVVATGGMAQGLPLAEGADLAVTAWDILSGDVRPGTRVLVCGDAGDHAGLQAADLLAEAGAQVEIVTPDRSFAPEVMAMNLVPYVQSLQARGAVFTVTWRLGAIRRAGNDLCARLVSDYGPAVIARTVDQVVVNHGTEPLDNLYFAPKPLSRNLGAVDHESLVAGLPQDLEQDLAPNPEGRFALYRIGDAVAARNTHAAIYDALRLMKAV